MKNEFVNQHPHTLGLNLYTLFKYMLGNKTNKYLPLIVKELHKSSEQRFTDYRDYEEMYQENIEKYDLKDTVLNSLSNKHKGIPSLLLQIMSDWIDIAKIQEFDKMLEDNLIENTDISTYKSMSDIDKQLNIAYTKKAMKEERKMVQVVMDNEEWFCVRPLTHSASIKYGAGTKWCTTMEKHIHHFNRYSQEGILIYLFNKLNSRKFGIHLTSRKHNPSMISIYDELDDRIDSTVARIPLETWDEIFKLVGFSLDSNEIETNVQYIHRVHPEIFKEYWDIEDYVDLSMTVDAEPAIVLDDFGPDEPQFNNEMTQFLADHNLVNNQEYQPHLSQMTDGVINTSQNSTTDEYVDYLIESIQERLKPKNIFHKWYRNIFYGGHEKLVLIGVPTRNHGIDAVKRTSEFFGETKGYKTLFYPIYEGKDLVVTKL
jgi:hypothetical protein